MNIALTGITGMVGSHLIKRLAESDGNGQKPNVRALIREGSVVEHLKPFEDVDYVLGGLEDKESLKNLVEDADCVIHLAALSRPRADGGRTGAGECQRHAGSAGRGEKGQGQAVHLHECVHDIRRSASRSG